MSTPVTAHFSVEEFACKDSTPFPTKWIVSRLVPLCGVLERIRTAAGGKAVKIISGYRSIDWNKKIGGARASRHMSGEAADIVIAGMTPAAVHALVLELYEAGELDALGGLGSYPKFTHIDIRSGDRLARWSGSRADG